MRIYDLLLDNNLLLVLGVITVLLLILMMIVIVMLFKLSALKKRYNIFMSGAYDKKDLEEVIQTLVKQLEYQEGKSIDIGKRLSVLENNIKYSVQKTGMIRYKAFDNKGGDQSFSLALLDDKNNGVVITSIYNDGVSSVYGKEIKNGTSEHRMSEEEIRVLENAQKFSAKNIVEPN